MTWTPIDSSIIATDKPIKASTHLAIQGNITAQANGDTGAPKTQVAATAFIIQDLVASSTKIYDIGASFGATTETSYPAYDPTSVTQQVSIMVMAEGVVRYEFLLDNNTTDDDGEAQILKNGAVVGTYTEPNSGGGGTVFTEDVTINYGDILTLRWRVKLEGSYEGGDVQVRDVSLSGNRYIPVHTFKR